MVRMECRNQSDSKEMLAVAFKMFVSFEFGKYKICTIDFNPDLKLNRCDSVG